MQILIMNNIIEHYFKRIINMISLEELNIIKYY